MCLVAIGNGQFYFDCIRVLIGGQLSQVLPPWKKQEPNSKSNLAMGDVVAQLVKATGRHQTEDAAVPSSNPAPPTVS
jgi:hypothetical protein